MAGALHEFLARDHKRLDGLLESCLRSEGEIPYETYDAFRRGLLRHIAIEERVLFPALRSSRGWTELERQLHRDHAAIAALLVLPPSPADLRQIAEILVPHNQLEEDNTQGLYDLVEQLAGAELPSLIVAAQRVADVRTAPHNDSPILRQSIATLVHEAEEGRKALARERS